MNTTINGLKFRYDLNQQEDEIVLHPMAMYTLLQVFIPEGGVEIIKHSNDEDGGTLIPHERRWDHGYYCEHGYSSKPWCPCWRD